MAKITREEFFLGLRRRAGLLQQQYDGPADDADEDTWAKRVDGFRKNQAKAAADAKLVNTLRAIAEERVRAAEAVGLVLVTDEKLIAGIEGSRQE